MSLRTPVLMFAEPTVAVGGCGWVTVLDLDLTNVPPATAWMQIAYESVRALNHATIGGDGGLEYPSQVYSTIGAGIFLLCGLRQATRHLSRILDEQAESGRVVADFGAYSGRTGEALADARSALADVAVSLFAAEEALATAHEATSGLAWTDPDDRA